MQNAGGEESERREKVQVEAVLFWEGSFVASIYSRGGNYNKGGTTVRERGEL